MESFRLALNVCSLQYLSTSCQRFTWSNNRYGREFTKERINRVMVNQEWQNWYSDASCIVLPVIKSDHSSLHINMIRLSKGMSKAQLVFRFEATWAANEDCTKIVGMAWEKGTGGHIEAETMRHRLASFQSTLLSWNTRNKSWNQRNSEGVWPR